MKPPAFDVILTVHPFPRQPRRSKSVPVVDHDIAMPNQNPKHCVLTQGDIQLKQPNAVRTIDVTSRGAVLRFVIKSPDGREKYAPVAITFERVDNVQPVAVPHTATKGPVPYTPFTELQMRGNTLSITDRPLSKRSGLVSPQSSKFTTYRYYIYVRRQSDGASAILDPEIENQDPP